MKALLLGLGQDTIILSQILEANGIEYLILARRSSGSIDKIRFSGLRQDRVFTISEISEYELLEVQTKFEFSHIFNFAADTFVQDSKLNFTHFVRNNSFLLFEILKLRNRLPNLWLFHPLSSEIISGKYSKFDLDTPIFPDPRNAYGVSKALEYLACKVSREKGEMDVNYCVMFNHESKYRSRQFFTKKVISFFQNLDSNSQNFLEIYNCPSQRDWGSAAEYMQMVFEAGLQRLIGESMLGTGHLFSVEQFIDMCISEQRLDCSKTSVDGLLKWEGKNFLINEKGRDLSDARRIMRADSNRVRATFGKSPQTHGKLLVRALLNGTV